LTACGSGNDKSSGNDKIVGADQGSETPKESAEPSAAPAEDKPDGVDLSLPKDMNLVFDWDKPKDKNEAAAMDDAANYLRAIYRGVDKRTTKDAAVTTYATGDGLRYANTQIDAWIDGGWTAIGTLRHYDATTRSATNGKSVEVAFCADAGKFRLHRRALRQGQVRRDTPVRSQVPPLLRRRHVQAPGHHHLGDQLDRYRRRRRRPPERHLWQRPGRHRPGNPVRQQVTGSRRRAPVGGRPGHALRRMAAATRGRHAQCHSGEPAASACKIRS
jgi:hypothetical protein